jgi:hypothetical protein
VSSCIIPLPTFLLDHKTYPPQGRGIHRIQSLLKFFMSGTFFWVKICIGETELCKKFLLANTFLCYRHISTVEREVGRVKWGLG